MTISRLRILPVGPWASPPRSIRGAGICSRRPALSRARAVTRGDGGTRLEGHRYADLTDGGLRPALRTLGRRSAVPVRLDIGIDGRLPEQVELAAYYCVAEALTNAAKHPHATVVTVTVRADAGSLRLASATTETAEPPSAAAPA